MKPFMLLIDETKLKALDMLASAAGSRLGDVNLMNLAVDVRRWLQTEMENASKEAVAAAERANGAPKKDATVTEAEVVQ